MKTSWLIIGLLISFTGFGQAQDVQEEYSPYELRIKSSYGYKFSLGESSNSLDPFVQFADKASTFSFLTYSIYYKEKWGIQVSFSTNKISGQRDSESEIFNRVNAEFGEEYFLNPINVKEDLSEETGRFFVAMLGVGRRFDYKKLIIRPTLSAGFTVVNLYDAYFNLKRKGKNEYRVYQIEAFPSSIYQEEKWFWTVSPSIELDYQVYKSIYFSTELTSNFTFLNHTFLETLTDEDENRIASEKLRYKKLSSTIGLGAGLSLIYKL